MRKIKIELGSPFSRIWNNFLIEEFNIDMFNIDCDIKSIDYFAVSDALFQYRAVILNYHEIGFCKEDGYTHFLLRYS
jgi:hypothetical protein